MPEQPGARCQGVPKGHCVPYMEGQDSCTLLGLAEPTGSLVTQKLGCDPFPPCSLLDIS